MASGTQLLLVAVRRDECRGRVRRSQDIAGDRSPSQTGIAFNAATDGIVGCLYPIHPGRHLWLEKEMLIGRRLGIRPQADDMSGDPLEDRVESDVAEAFTVRVESQFGIPNIHTFPHGNRPGVNHGAEGWRGRLHDELPGQIAVSVAGEDIKEQFGRQSSGGKMIAVVLQRLKQVRVGFFLLVRVQ